MYKIVIYNQKLDGWFYDMKVKINDFVFIGIIFINVQYNRIICLSNVVLFNNSMWLNKINCKN